MSLKIKKISVSLFVLIWSTQLFASDLLNGYKPLEHFKKTSTEAFDTTGLWILGAGVAATALAFQYDQSTHDSWKNNQQMSKSLSQYGDFWGSGIPEVVIIGAQIYYDKENGLPALEGLAVSTLVTHSAKFLIARERPDSTTRTSMPSGHTQAAFSLAASMTESYGWKKSLGFWAMAVITGASRLADNAHWLSDVTAGATIGVLFGRAAFAHHFQLQPSVLFNENKIDGAKFLVSTSW